MSTDCGSDQPPPISQGNSFRKSSDTICRPDLRAFRLGMWLLNRMRSGPGRSQMHLDRPVTLRLASTPIEDERKEVMIGNRAEREREERPLQEEIEEE